MSEPRTEAGRALDALLAYRQDPPTYLPGDWYAEYRTAILAIEAEAARAAVARLHDREDRWRLVRVSTDLLSVFGTRTETGDRITAEWGEPDADGIYDPIFRTTVDPDWGRAAVEARDRELRAAVLQSPSRWVEFYDGNPSVPVISLAAVLALLHPADAG